LAITVVIFAIGLVSIILFAIKGKDLAVEAGGFIGKFNATFSMAVVIFAILVLYSWANMANPVSIERVAGLNGEAAIRYADLQDRNSEGVRFVGLGGLGDSITGHFEQLYLAFVNSEAPNVANVSLTEATMFVDLAVKLTALRENADFEPNLFSGRPDFYDLKKVIEQAYEKLP